MRTLDSLRRLAISLALAAAPLAACGGPAGDTVTAQHDPPLAADAGTTAPDAGAPGARPTRATVVAAPGADAHRTTPLAPPPPAASRVARAGDLTVRRAVLALDVVDHEPVVAPAELDASAPRVYLFLDVRNDATAPAELRVSFARTDVASPERGGVALEVPAAARRFRTWAWTRQVRAPGAWVAIVRDAGGTEVARVPFTVVRGAAID